jgi:type I restriction enzyme S subunit
MNKWKLARIGDICETNKQSYSLSENWEYVNYLDTGNLTENRVSDIQHIIISIDKLPSRARRKVAVGDILYSTVRPNQRHYGIVKQMLPNMLVSTGFIVITVKSEMANSDFLYYYLTQNDVVDGLHAIGEQSVSAYPSIKPSDIENLELLLPPLDEQKKIGEMLRALDDKIGRNNAINHNLEQMAQVVFDNLYGLGQEGTLSELITVKYGKDHKKLANGSIPVYGSGGIMRFADTALYNGESVLIPRKGTLNNVIYVNKPFWSVDTMFYTEMKRPNVAKFVYFFVRTNDLASMDAGSAVPSMTTKILNELSVMIPEESDLATFEEFVAPLFTQINSNHEENAHLVIIRDSLLPKLMSGQLSVNS